MARTTAELKDSGIENRALRAGDRMPDFSLPNQHGEMRRFADFLADSTVVLNIYRGGWCPYCNLHLSELRHAEARLKALGFDVWFISIDQPDVLVVDTAAGISPTVARFVQAAQHAIVVVCDEPASLTDAYALIKVFSQNYGMTRFNVVTNRSRNAQHGKELYKKLMRVTDRYLDVVLRHLGDVPQDNYLVKAVQEQRAVVDAYPKSPAGEGFRRIAAAVDAGDNAAGVGGKLGHVEPR